MVVISSAELRSNMKKYLDLGKNETFVLTAQQNSVEYDLSSTVDEVIARVREGLTEMFERKESAKAVGE